MLKLDNALSEPWNGAWPDPAVLAAHRRFQDHDSIIIIDCTDAKQLGDDLCRA